MKEKRIYSFFLMLFFGITCSAQVFDFDTQWYYCQAGFVNVTERCSMAELQYTETKNDTLYGVFIDQSKRHEVKQVGKKVWFDGLKIYDFDLKVGDSLTIRDYDGYAGKYLLDSIQTKFIYGKNRTLQFTDIYVLVEGIGTAFHYDGKFYKFHFDQGELFIIADPTRTLKFIKFEDDIEKFAEDNCSACDALVNNLEVTQSSSLSIYPNPVSDWLYINGVTGENFAIYDQLGKLLVKQKFSEQNGIDVSSLLPGVYVLLIDDNMTTRFVKE